MKTLLNCDDVFDVLTAGPFPTGDRGDESIHQHLAGCAACRRLAAALKPACGLLHEVMPAAERAGLPIYLADEDAQTERIMRRVRQQPRKREVRGHHFSARQMLIWNSLVATLLLIAVCPWTLGSRNGARAVADGDPYQALLGLALPAECLQVAMAGGQRILHPPARATAACQTCHASDSVPIAGYSVQTLRYSCCTECHSVSLPEHPQVRDMNRLVAACQTCHAATHEPETANEPSVWLLPTQYTRVAERPSYQVTGTRANRG